jgi:hypothetical protein
VKGPKWLQLLVGVWLESKLMFEYARTYINPLWAV